MTKIKLMPNSQRIGRNVEDLLKEFLNSLSFEIDSPVRIFPDDLRLMSSGSQHGLDLNWEIRFNQGTIRYVWYIEAKGVGYSEYIKNKTHKHKAYHINLISDKLLQSLAYAGLNIDCWCLFAPFLKLDTDDRIELSKIQDHLPFKLVIWDKDFLFHRINKINPRLFKTIYSKELTRRLRVSNDIAISTINILREHSVSGRFWNEVHKRYWLIRNDIAAKCKKELIFQCEIQPRITNRRRRPLVDNKQYYFLYEARRYNINKQVLLAASAGQTTTQSVHSFGPVSINTVSVVTPNLDSIRAILQNSICTATRRNLEEEFKDILSMSDNPFLHVQIKYKISDFFGLIPLEVINSATYFNCSEDKPVYLESIKDFVQ